VLLYPACKSVRQNNPRKAEILSETFTLGDLTIHRVIESEGPLFDPLVFFPTLTQEMLDENQSWLKPAYIDPASGQFDAVRPILHRAHTASYDPDRQLHRKP
jgi:hypothetical protein